MLDAYWNGAFPDPQLLGIYPPSLAEAMAPYQQAGDLARICRPIDWFGLNHYSPLYVIASDGNPLGVVVRPSAGRGTAILHGLAGRAGRVPRDR